MNFKKDVSTVLSRFDSQVKTWKGWRTRPIPLETYDKVMNTMEFGKKATEQIESKVNEDFEGFLFRGYPQITAWLLYNILTWYITHKAASLNHRVGMERGLRGALNGIKK